MTTVYHAIQLPLFDSKVCTSCHIEKPLFEFPVDRSKKTEHRTKCSLCWNPRNRAARNHEQYKEYKRNYDYKRRHNVETHEEMLVSYQRHHSRNRKSRNESCRQWAQKNPLKRIELNARRRLRKMNVTYGQIDYASIFETYGRHCHICEQSILPEHKVDLDHVIPLARGGTHTQDNLRPAHAICNRRKKDKLLSEMTTYQRRGI